MSICRLLIFSLAVAALLSLTAAAQSNNIQHVLLISVDGLHALDVSRYIESHPHSALAELASHGVTYTNARTPANSDSFPGLLALIQTGDATMNAYWYGSLYAMGSASQPGHVLAGMNGQWVSSDFTQFTCVTSWLSDANEMCALVEVCSRPALEGTSSGPTPRCAPTPFLKW